GAPRPSIRSAPRGRAEAASCPWAACSPPRSPGRAARSACSRASCRAPRRAAGDGSAKAGTEGLVRGAGFGVAAERGGELGGEEIRRLGRQVAAVVEDGALARVGGIARRVEVDDLLVGPEERSHAREIGVVVFASRFIETRVDR